MDLLTTAPELSTHRRPLAFVPTMGALHEGHASLIRQGASIARQRNLPGGCVVSIFVNPTQFNDPNDLARYPRTLEADLETCARAGAGAVFAPPASEVYPPQAIVRVPMLPRVATLPGLEDARRPGHFAGVCQVVLRLFELVRPTVALFGEKDWQQLQVVRAMVAAEGLDIEIAGVPTVREPDGLAMSSRNRFLAPSDRQRAAAIFAALRSASRRPTPAEAEESMRQFLASASIDPEYAVVRESESLAPFNTAGSLGPWRALVAARVGPIRLLDNMGWGVPPS